MAVRLMDVLRCNVEVVSTTLEQNQFDYFSKGSLYKGSLYNVREIVNGIFFPDLYLMADSWSIYTFKLVYFKKGVNNS